MHSINLFAQSGSNAQSLRLRKVILLGGMLLAALSGCGAPPGPDAPSATATYSPPPATQPLEGTSQPLLSPYLVEPTPAATRSWEARPIATPPTGAERVPAPEEPLQGEVPPAMMSAVLEDAMGRAGVGLEAIQVLRAEAVEWPDGSLGCPQPGMEYLQVITPGYWVELQIGAVKYDYRITQSGYLRLCENRLPAKP